MRSFLKPSQLYTILSSLRRKVREIYKTTGTTSSIIYLKNMESINYNEMY